MSAVLRGSRLVRRRGQVGVVGLASRGRRCVDESALDCDLERGADDHVDLEDRLRRQPGAGATARDCERFVELIEMVGSKTPQRDLADGGVDVALHEPRIPIRGGGSDVPTLLRQPRLSEEGPESDRAAGGRTRSRSLPSGVETSGDRLRLGPVVADWMPSPALPAGERVEPLVGDDVEAVLALDGVDHGAEALTTSTPTRRAGATDLQAVADRVARRSGAAGRALRSRAIAGATAWRRPWCHRRAGVRRLRR